MRRMLERLESRISCGGRPVSPSTIGADRSAFTEKECSLFSYVVVLGLRQIIELAAIHLYHLTGDRRAQAARRVRLLFQRGFVSRW